MAIRSSFAGFCKTGDRVQLGGIKSDVIDAGILRTTMMECREWAKGDQYNGRVVRVANSFVFKQPVLNYSGDQRLDEHRPRPFRHSATLALALLTMTLPAVAAAQHEATPQRPSFTNDTSVTASGSFEVELGFTKTDALWLLPTNLKFTPDVDFALLRLVEWSVSFDAFAKPSGRSGGFGDVVTLAARKEILASGRWAVGVAPLLGISADGSGDVQPGLKGIVVLAAAGTSFAANATVTSDDLALALDVSRTFGKGRTSSRLGWVAGLQWRRPEGLDAALDVGQGLSYRLRPDAVLDVAVRQTDVTGDLDIEALFGVTLNVASLRS